jgi:exopolyphosphatase/guanosine-5'-triphosphate,3'-diphosphate pyrophosphatase
MSAFYRELLYFAGILHDIGYVIGHQSHHKHSYYLISNGELRGFEQQEIEIMANVARYHRKDRPKKSHYSFQRLRPEHRRAVARLASFLRLADALDRTHYSVVEDLRCSIGSDGVCIDMVTRRDAELELWTAQRNVELFEREFGLSLEFRLAAPAGNATEPGTEDTPA